VLLNLKGTLKGYLWGKCLQNGEFFQNGKTFVFFQFSHCQISLKNLKNPISSSDSGSKEEIRMILVPVLVHT